MQVETMLFHVILGLCGNAVVKFPGSVLTWVVSVITICMQDVSWTSKLCANLVWGLPLQQKLYCECLRARSLKLLTKTTVRNVVWRFQKLYAGSAGKLAVT